MEDWNRTFENNFNDFLGISSNTKNSIIDGTKYYEKTFEKTKEIIILNNYYFNRYIELYGMSPEIIRDKKMIEDINAYILKED